MVALNFHLQVPRECLAHLTNVQEQNNLAKGQTLFSFPLNYFSDCANTQRLHQLRLADIIRFSCNFFKHYSATRLSGCRTYFIKEHVKVKLANYSCLML